MGKGDSSTARYVSSTPRENSSSKVASLYHTISGKVLGSREIEKSDTSSCGIELNSQSSVPTSQSYHNIPPPPPPTGSRRPQSHLEDIVTSSELMSNVGCMDVRERLESHLKEKLHDIMGRSSLLGRIARPLSSNEKGDERNIDESEYQRISEPSDSPAGDRISGTKQAVRALIHQEPSTAVSTPTSPHRHREQAGKVVRHYPASDPEETVLFTSTERQEQGQREKIRKQNNSCESLTLSSVSVNSRRSSMDLGDRKTLVVVIGTSSKGAKARLMQKQRSWETFPPKKHDIATLGETYGKFCRETGSFGGGFDTRPQSSGGGQGTVGLRGEIGSLKKADSFEGHEEAVRTLVAAVQETRSQHMLQQQRKQSHTKPSSN
uniref:Uncharacterized protein n=1 Tax=Timema douglasi TaxID=61478 RepID=A0A7R8VX17_TIMDO|nr:unnamed protein product [Timema douglasi]